MHTKNTLIKDIEHAGIKPNGTLIIHSSMKSLGQVEGGAETVLDVFIEYMKEGLLLFPTHSWSEKNLKDGIYNPKTEPSNVGILPNLFMKRDGAVRSMHPTHSVTAIGSRASEYTKRDDSNISTPCPRHGCFGGLYDENAQILFLGTTFTSNTYIHAIEEWLDIPNRISKESREIQILQSDGSFQAIDFYPHIGSTSLKYDKLLKPMLDMGIVKKVKIGDATSYLVEARPLTVVVERLLKENPQLFDDMKPLKSI